MGHLSEVTVLFADACGFTALVHERGPEEITPFIDEFFKRCATIVVNHDGIIDHFRGDAVLAFFNIPGLRLTPFAAADRLAGFAHQILPAQATSTFGPTHLECWVEPLTRGELHLL